MKFVAPHFFDVSLRERRFIFLASLERQHEPILVTNNSAVEAAEEMESQVEELAYDALESFLFRNPEISEFFKASDQKSSENSLGERAFQDLHERISEYINDKKKLGIQISPQWEKDVADLMAETVCKVIYLESMKNVDPLTGLPNRRAFEERLKEEILRSGRVGPLSLLIFDLDKFKWVNDTYGHLAGDQVLREIADCFRASDECKKILRDTDFVARNGGDELFILLPKTDMEGACVAAHRIATSIKGKKFHVGRNGDAKTIQLSSSIGVSEFEEASTDPDGNKMIDRADECLYIMKGEKPDRKGVTQERRGNIACNGKIISKEEIHRILDENPDVGLPIDISLKNRDRIMSI